MSRFVPGEGPKPCAGMIVGMAPGVEEDKALRPFVGRSGQLLDEALDLADLDRANVYVTNLVKRMPPNHKPTKKMIDRDMPLLVEEGNLVDPSYTLILGKVVASALFPRTVARYGNMTAMRGNIFNTDGRVWHFTWHPSFVLRTGNKGRIRDEFMIDVATFAAAVKAAGPRSIPQQDTFMGMAVVQDDRVPPRVPILVRG